ncbi:MAG TPA: hypothetical protein VF669_15275 [Tepidisphaeraceae bacterium]|jgi:hypothetical protein
MKRTPLILLALVALGLFTLTGSGQNQTPTEDGSDDGIIQNAARPTLAPPYVEQMLVRQNAIIARGYTDLGSIRGDDGSTVHVLAIQLSDVATKEMVGGLLVQVRSTRGRTAETYVDANDIDKLLQATDEIRKLDRTVTPLNSFDGHYRTVAGLEVNNIEREGARVGEIRTVQLRPSTGDIVWARSLMRASRLEEFKRLLSAGRDKIAQFKKDPTTNPD